MTCITPVAGHRTSPLLRLLNLAARRMQGQEPPPLEVIDHSPGFFLPSVAMSRFCRSEESP